MKKSIFLSKLFKITMYFYLWPIKYTESNQKTRLLVIKGDFEPQYFTLRTIEKHGNLSVQNVLNI